MTRRSEAVQNTLRIDRRGFFHRAGTSVLALMGALLVLPARAAELLRPPALHRPVDPTTPTEFERLHTPHVKIPLVVEDGANVPCFVEMDHPMEPDHYIMRVHIMNYRDPIIWKGTFHLTPESGGVYLYSQLRLDSGKSTVYAVAECNRHGRWVGSAEVDVAVGGC